MPPITDSHPRRRRRLVRTLTAAASGLALLTITACTGTPNADDNAGGPAKISVFAQQGTGQDLATNAFTKQLEKKFNIKFSWQTTTQDS